MLQQIAPLLPPLVSHQLLSKSSPVIQSDDWKSWLTVKANDVLQKSTGT
jgi:hypothetical protein